MLAGKTAGQEDSEFFMIDPILTTPPGPGRNSGWDVENGKGVICLYGHDRFVEFNGRPGKQIGQSRERREQRETIFTLFC